MPTSVIDIFKVGLGPSSSHTVGPMRAASYFIQSHEEKNVLDEVNFLRVEFFGSLGSTGVGHGTDRAVMLGLEGADHETITADRLEERSDEILSSKRINFAGRRLLNFVPKKHLFFYKQKILPFHPNGMRFTSFNSENEILVEKEYYSVGGGFVRNDRNESISPDLIQLKDLKYPYQNGRDLLELCKKNGVSISHVVMENEKAWRPAEETRQYLLKIWSVMDGAIYEGCHKEGILPGKLKVKRRAASIYKKLKVSSSMSQDPLQAIDWVNLYAMAVNEVNASGGRVVTAPTNGAAGILPSVLKYYQIFMNDDSDESVIRYLATAFAIGLIFKKNASLSGAEVGCQGEVGVACSMAAAALTELKGGTPEQVENAAEIGIEHNLGLTCDPIGGLVQVPCIERNSMGAVKAINSSRIAMCGDGQHKVHLDEAVKTMLQTGADMKKKYKETSRGGLAVNVVEC